MTPKQRVNTILSFQEADRVPWDYWAVDEITGKLIDRLGLSSTEELLQRFDVDFRYIQGPSYAGQELKVFEDGISEDLWGVKRKTITVDANGITTTYKELAQSPLEKMATAGQIEKYDHWPAAEWWDYSTVSAECKQYSDYVVVNAGDRLDRTAQLKPMMYLRGVEQTFLDMAMNPKITEAIIARIKEYFLQYNRRLFDQTGDLIDIFMMGDDFGTQKGMMMSVAMWRKYFKDGFRRYIELAHKYDIKVMHHTCGSVEELVPDFIECGLDILQSVQPQAEGMDLKKLKREYGKDIAFHGSIDIQNTLPNGTPDDIRNEVAARMEAGKSGGGFIISTSHNIQGDTPIENVLMLFESYKEYGKY